MRILQDRPDEARLAVAGERPLARHHLVDDRWSRDGSALFFIRLGATQAVMRSTVGEDAAGAPVIGAADFQIA